MPVAVINLIAFFLHTVVIPRVGIEKTNVLLWHGVRVVYSARNGVESVTQKETDMVAQIFKGNRMQSGTSKSASGGGRLTIHGSFDVKITLRIATYDQTIQTLSPLQAMVGNAETPAQCGVHSEQVLLL